MHAHASSRGVLRYKSSKMKMAKNYFAPVANMNMKYEIATYELPNSFVIIVIVCFNPYRISITKINQKI